jgi:hypothetical protein
MRTVAGLRIGIASQAGGRWTRFVWEVYHVHLFHRVPAPWSALDRSIVILVVMLWPGVVAEFGRRWTLVNVWVSTAWCLRRGATARERVRRQEMEGIRTSGPW